MVFYLYSFLIFSISYKSTTKVFERGGKILRQTKEAEKNIEQNMTKSKTNADVNTNMNMNMENLTKFQINAEMVDLLINDRQQGI